MNDGNVIRNVGFAMPTAILVIAHGSRLPEANADLHHVVDELRRRGDYPIVELAFLEIAEPTIEQAGHRCVERGATEVILLPYFLSPGRHGRDDLARHCRDLASQFPQIAFH